MAVSRNVPRCLTRLNYFTYPGIVPHRPNDPMVHVDFQRQIEEVVRSTFHLHVHGPCEGDCAVHADFKGQPKSEWPFLALRRYVLGLNEVAQWRGDPIALAIYGSLTAPNRALINRVDNRRGQRSWATLLPLIATDQCFFWRATQKGGSAIVSSANGAKRSVYVAYSVHASFLQGETSLERMAKRGKVGKRSHKEIGRCVENFRGRIAAHFPPSPNRGVLEQIKARQGFDSVRPPLCCDMGEVYEWFALALKNLERYSDGQNPLPWAAPTEETALRKRPR